MSDIQNKFRLLLRELFQFDSADLDFGIYRIMNYRRDVIKRFISDDLPKAIAGELEQGALAEQSQAQEALEDARQKVLETLDEDALDAEGNLAEHYHTTKVGKDYLEAQARAAGARDGQALEAAIYNHLYTFFSRYYQDGDFISKRRYSKKERYAIPYNGEEVTLYWANHDQYYIKTAEHFTDYTWKAPNGVAVHFKLQAADVEQNNVKGDKRFFLPRLDEIAGDEDAGELFLPFEYRPLTAQEAISYGKRKQQDAIIAQALEAIPKRLAKNARAVAALTAERRKTADGEPVSYLEHHLRQYTRRNSSDFFIHKDLQDFLARELDFYLKNEYKHSTWVSMMADRVSSARGFLSTDGVMEVAIDDTENPRLRMLLDNVFGSANRVASISAEVNPAGQNLRPNAPALSHDYCHIYARDIDRMEMLLRALTEEEEKLYRKKDKNGYFLWDNLRRRGGNSRPSDRPKQWFPLYVDLATRRVSVDPFEGAQEVWPIDPKGERRIWRVNPDGARREIAADKISVIEKARRIEVVKKTYKPEGKKPKTLWKNSAHSATTHGTKLLIDILGRQSFSYPKSLFLVKDCLQYWADEIALVLDFFAGSGTTGHAVINLNRENASTGSAQAAGRRKFILVEMGDYFDTVLLPRIKKVTFSPEWKDGKPKRMATQEEAERSPRVVKVMRLESYEDALNNIEFDDASGQQALQFEDYLLQYMLKWETRHSETLLNVEQLANPFSYQLHIHRDGETRTQSVDLPETFNYLLGLDVQARKVYDDNGRRYLVYRGVKRNGRTVAVIWRETEGWEQSGYERDRDFVAAQKMVEGADEVFVNGDSFIPGAQALEGLFKARMFAEAEA